MENNNDEDWWWSNNYVLEHPLLNTFIVMDDYKSEKQIDYTDGKIFDITKFNLNNCMYDTHIIFTVDNIEENNNILHIEGTVGYYYDPKFNIKFIYDLNENKIYIASNYRLLHSPDENQLYKDTFEMPLNKIWTYKDNKIVENDVTEYELSVDDDGVPYYRFPRSKDGIGIPRVIFNVFKIFSDENAVKPKIIIPSNYYIYGVGTV